VVRGYRKTDLGAELAGARSVLASAGIQCRIIGSSDAIAEPAQEALGWVVREATTNVLRHSQATTCTIALQVGEDSVELSMENDGAPGSGALALGHGLIGLTERMAAAGGTLTAERLPGARFRVVARLPVAAADQASGGATVSPADAGNGHTGRGGEDSRADRGAADGRSADGDRAEAMVP